MAKSKPSVLDRRMTACKDYCGEHLLAVIGPLPDRIKMRILDFWLHASL